VTTLSTGPGVADGLAVEPGSVPSGERGWVGAVAMVVGGAFSQQFGAAVATKLFPRVGPAGAVSLRLTIGALVLLALLRPAVRGYQRTDWSVIAAFGVALAGMNLLFYEAIQRLPLGAAVTLEVLGPLVLSVVKNRTRLSWLWAGVALVGVALLGRSGLSGITPAGAALALGAGAFWAAYILLSAQTGSRFPRTDGLALSMTVAAAISLPLGLISAGSALVQPVALGAGAVVAICSSVLPYSLEMRALRRLPAGTFAVLMSLMPAVAATAGWVVLHQALDLTEALAIGLVVIASAGAVRARRQSGSDAAQTDGPPHWSSDVGTDA
jgi:inner membrane transporter RhtA